MKKYLLILVSALFVVSCAGPDPRAEWVDTMDRIARPVVFGAAEGRLKATMPYESTDQGRNRREFSYLEALGRTICGIAPWLESERIADPAEARLQHLYRDKCRKALSNAVNPESPDHMVFEHGTQPLVDAAYLAEGLLRAPVQLWEMLPEADKDNLVSALKAVRSIEPHENNWLLFASQVEAALLEFTGECDMERLLYGVERFRDSFYKGDGMYGDGESFHMDYYNSYMIHPMLLDVLTVMEKHGVSSDGFLPLERVRHTRYSAILEKMISPEGTYPVLGRSIVACRTGVFHCLAQDALNHSLPATVNPGGVRAALGAVIRRQFASPANFGSAGFLRVGFTGSQLKMAEDYVNTGSLYHCLTVFLPLGLASDDPFWTDPDSGWSSVKAWSGQPLEGDHSIEG